MKETVERCSLCHRTDCDGKEWQTPDMCGSYGFHVGVKRVCRNCDGVILRNGLPITYRLVSGHGDYYDYPLTEVPNRVICATQKGGDE